MRKKKEKRKESKIKMVAYLRGSTEELDKQRKTCNEAADALEINVKIFWESHKTSPLHRSLFKKMINYSCENGVDLWMVERKKIIAPKKGDLLPILKELQTHFIKLLLIKPCLLFHRPLYFSDVMIAKTDNSLRYFVELKKQLLKHS